MKFTKFSQLISYMLLAKRYQKLVLKNSKVHPPNTLPPIISSKNHFMNQTMGQPTKPSFTKDSNARGRGICRGKGKQSFRGKGCGCNTFKPNQRCDDNNRPQEGWRGWGHGSFEGRSLDWGQGKHYTNQDKQNSNPIICSRCGTKGHPQNIFAKFHHTWFNYTIQVRNLISYQEVHDTLLDGSDCFDDAMMIDQPKCESHLTLHKLPNA